MDDVESRRNLVEAGFLACLINETRDARAIFNGLEALHENNREAALGLAFADITDGRHNDAVQRLDALIAAGDADAIAFAGLALRLDGRAGESENLLNRLAGQEGAAAALAHSLI